MSLDPRRPKESILRSLDDYVYKLLNEISEMSTRLNGTQPLQSAVGAFLTDGCLLLYTNSFELNANRITRLRAWFKNRAAISAKRGDKLDKKRSRCLDRHYYVIETTLFGGALR